LYMAMTEQPRFIGVDSQYLAETGFLFIFILIFAFYKSFHTKLDSQISTFLSVFSYYKSLYVV
ncbi:hypothetical protein ACPTGI_14550, partial [Enterococcus faecium]